MPPVPISTSSASRDQPQQQRGSASGRPARGSPSAASTPRSVGRSEVFDTKKLEGHQQKWRTNAGYRIWCPLLGKTYNDPKMFTVFPWRADTPEIHSPMDMDNAMNSFHLSLGRSSEFPSSEIKGAAVAAYEHQTTIVAGEYRAGGANTVEARMQVCLPLSETDDVHYRCARGEKVKPLVELFGVTDDVIAEGCPGDSALVMKPVFGLTKETRKRRAFLIKEAADVRATRLAMDREREQAAAADSAQAAPVSGATSSASSAMPSPGASSVPEGFTPYLKRRESPGRPMAKPRPKARPASGVGLRKKGT